MTRLNSNNWLSSVPRGLAGLAYWYALYPFHAWIFRGLIKAIATRAERTAQEVDNPTPPSQTPGRLAPTELNNSP